MTTSPLRRRMIMARTLKTLTVLVTLSLGGSSILPAQSAAPPARTTSSDAIDRELWSVIAATVVNADIEGMARTYHPDAILVSPAGTKPIATQLAEWGRDMAAAKTRGDKATVEFRFTRRQDDATTAFETGLFKYTVTDKAGKSVSSYVPFESLLERSGGKWRTLMERQLAPVTVDAWNRLKP